MEGKRIQVQRPTHTVVEWDSARHVKEEKENKRWAWGFELGDRQEQIIQGLVGHFKVSGFDSKTNGEAQKGFKLGNAMIRLMLSREQDWTQGRQIEDSLPRSYRSTAPSLQPSVDPASALITFNHHHLLHLWPPLQWDYSPLYIQHLHSSCLCQASFCCWMKGWLSKQPRNSEASLIQIQFPKFLKMSHNLGGGHSVEAEDARWSVPSSSW